MNGGRREGMRLVDRIGVHQRQDGPALGIRVRQGHPPAAGIVDRAGSDGEGGVSRGILGTEIHRSASVLDHVDGARGCPDQAAIDVPVSGTGQVERVGDSIACGEGDVGLEGLLEDSGFAGPKGPKTFAVDARLVGLMGEKGLVRITGPNC